MDLKAKKAALVAEARTLIAAAKAAPEGPSEADMTAIDAKNAEITNVTAAIERAEKAAAFEAQFAAVDADVVEAPVKSDRKVAAKTLGQHLVKTAPEFKSARHNNHNAFETPEFKAAGDLTTVGTRTYVDQDNVVVGLDRRIPTVASVLTPGTLSGNTLAYTVIEAVEGSAGATAEGGQKPKLTFKPKRVLEGLSKIAALTDISDEMIEDEEYVVSAIDNELVNELIIEEEDQILNGDGALPNVLGLLNRSGLQTETAANEDDNADAIHRAKRKVHTATNRRATAIFINPVDYEKERLRKDANGQYVGGGMFTGSYGTAFVDEPNMWGLTTIQTTAIAEGTALVGDFNSVTLLRKGGIKIDRSSENKDNFEKNVVTLRAEERVGLKVPKPYALVKVTLSDVAAA
jgi:HK97 family phage major capsid protein